MVFAGCNFKAPPVREGLSQKQMAEKGAGGDQEKPVCKDLASKYTKSGRSVIPAKQLPCRFY